MRYIVGLLIAVGLVAIFIIILMRAIFGGGDTPVEQKRVNLADYDRTNVVMRVVIDGPVTVDEEHRQVHIQVARDNNTIQIIRGYQGEVIQKEQANSNSSAYGNFLRAIDLLGYSNGNKDKSLEDYRGHCPFGNRYIFQIVEGDDIKQQFWSTSCGDGEGSFGGQTDQIVELFQAQIPGYNDITADLSL
jgi:hypothetical protein